MLELSSKPNEQIKVSGPYTITLLEILGGNFRIGIQAEKDVEIWGGELVADGRVVMPAAHKKSENGLNGTRMYKRFFAGTAIATYCQRYRPSELGPHRGIARERLRNAHSGADDVENCVLLRTIL
jgi:sRNA-binding carbon storage regulator CsrA